MSTVLEVEGLAVHIPLAEGVLEAVRGVSFRIERGETLCIVGESGCGKTLTALAAMNLLPRRARRSVKRLEFLGEDLCNAREQRLAELRGDRMAMIFQDPMTSLNPAWTVGDQLEEAWRRHRPRRSREARDRAVHLLERVGITAAPRRLTQYPHQLSGGLRQRVMIAMALMCEPDLLIADEPTTALDVTVQAQILHLLAELRREMRLALMLISHDLGLVARVADRVAVMYAGEVVEMAPAAALFAAPRHPYTVGLLRCIPVPGRTPPGTPLGAIPGTVPGLVGGLAGCGFRVRCDRAGTGCGEAVPLTGEIDGHRWRCLHPVEAA